MFLPVLVRRLAFPLVVVGGLGCDGQEGSVVILPPTLSSVSVSLPSLRSVPLPNLASDAIADVGVRVAVGPDGQIAFPPARSPDDPTQLRVVDSTGAVVGRLGPRGEGPGELKTPMFFAFLSDTSLVAWDMGTGRVTVYSTAGPMLTSLETGMVQSPRALVGDSIDFRDASRPEAPFVRRPLGGGRSRNLVESTHPVFDSVFPVRAQGGIQSRGMIPYAAGAGRVAVGNIRTYRLLLYDATGTYRGSMGRSVPPQFPTAEQVVAESLSLMQQPTVSPAGRTRMLRRLRETPITFFRELRFDEQGRLWVLRPENGSAVADLYADTTFIGSLPIDCPGFAGSGVDLRHGWLVLTCRALDPNAMSNGTLRLFRVDG